MFKCKTFSIIKDNKRAAIELTEQFGENQYYFNRLIVDKNLRGQGYSIKLMNQMVEWQMKPNQQFI